MKAPVLPSAVDLLLKSERYHRSSVPDSDVLIVGVPNVGKSSLINQIRSGNLRIKGKASRVGAHPGVTRALETRIRVSTNPSVFLLDTPGILMPNIKDMHVGMKLAACASISNEVVGAENVVDYVLYHLNKTGRFGYVDYMKLDRPYDDVRVLMAKAALSLNFTKDAYDLEKGHRTIKPDFTKLSEYFLKGFRKGAYGPFILDYEELGLYTSGGCT